MGWDGAALETPGKKICSYTHYQTEDNVSKFAEIKEDGTHIP